jgi:hypothetical protein
LETDDNGGFVSRRAPFGHRTYQLVSRLFCAARLSFKLSNQGPGATWGLFFYPIRQQQVGATPRLPASKQSEADCHDDDSIFKVEVEFFPYGNMK